MNLSPFHALYLARRLSNYAFGTNKFIPVFASSNMEIYPYQIAAAMFALRSPYLKGAILCDDGALGKSFEAMLVIAQLWYEGRQRIMLIVPAPLLHQWRDLLNNHFSVPFYSLDNHEAVGDDASYEGGDAFQRDGLVLTTYDCAHANVERIARISWDVVLFDEAHHLRRICTGENKMASSLREATEGAFKLLLTATPMQNSIMDLYGLIYFIDETALPDQDSFYMRYFRKPENYAELAGRVSKHCFRATRPQVMNYVKLPKRIVMTAEYSLSEPERQLYDMIEAYLAREKKAAFPKMDSYELTLMFFHTFSSSTAALTKTLGGVVKRLEALAENNPLIAPELNEVRAMLDLSNGISWSAKDAELLRALEAGFAELKNKGAREKALIFTENRTSQRHLYALLNHAYEGKVLSYNGDKSWDYSIIAAFAQGAQILIATDVAAEGFNLEFCSFVINYDLPYNTLTIEQRINRCHRQGQQSDVLILNFLNRDNFADVRMLELINKRVLQFSGIFGMKDSVLGNFGVDVPEAMRTARTKDEVERAYVDVLAEYEAENKSLVRQAEASLFTSFSEELSKQVTVSPQYIIDESKRINDDLWRLTEYFFAKYPAFHIDRENRTISCVGSPPKVFTGTTMRRNEYSMSPKYQPASGRHTITGALARNILSETFWTGVPERGRVVIDGVTGQCVVGLYQIKVKPHGALLDSARFDVLVGQTSDGRLMTDKECRALMALPVVGFSTDGEPVGQRDGLTKPKRPEPLDALIDTQVYIQKALEETRTAEAEEIEKLRAHTADLKHGLSRHLDSLRSSLKSQEAALQGDISRLERIQAQKQFATLQRELKQREQSLFFDGLRLEQQLDEQIAELLENAKLVATVQREFIIRVEGIA